MKVEPVKGKQANFSKMLFYSNIEMFWNCFIILFCKLFKGDHSYNLLFDLDKCVCEMMLEMIM